MVLATKMGTCPKVTERAFLVRDHTIVQEAKTQRIVLTRLAFVDKRHRLINEIALEVQFAEIWADVRSLATQSEPVNSDPVVAHPLYFDLGGVEVVTVHPASRHPVWRHYLDYAEGDRLPPGVLNRRDQFLSKSPHLIGSQPLALTCSAVELIVVLQTQEN